MTTTANQARTNRRVRIAKPKTTGQKLPKLPKLHDKRSVGLAAFLGSPISGGLLIAHNLLLLKRVPQAALAAIVGCLVTAALVGIGMAMPDGIRLGVIIPLAMAFATQAIANKLFSAEYKLIESGSGKAHGLGLSLLLSVLVMASLFGAIYILVS